MSEDADYSVTVKIRNGRMLYRMRLVGIENGSQLAKLAGVAPSVVGRLLNFKEIPLNQREQWRGPVQRLATALRCMPEDLFPEQHLRSPLKTNTSEFSATAKDVVGYLQHAREAGVTPERLIERDEVKKMLSAELDSLTPRQKYVLERHHALDGEKPDTLRELGDKLNVGPERIRQIEAKAMRLLKHRLMQKLSKEELFAAIES